MCLTGIAIKSLLDYFSDELNKRINLYLTTTSISSKSIIEHIVFHY